MKIFLNSLYGATALGSFRYGSVTLVNQLHFQANILFMNLLCVLIDHMNKVIRNEIEL